MHNSIPYFFLIAFFIPLLIWTIVKKREPGLILVFFTYVGMGFVVEFIIMVLFDSYEYKPNLLEVPYYDNVMGAVVSDIISVPVISLVVATYRLRFWWIVLFAAGFGLIEKVFRITGVYETNWWRISYTVGGFVLVFWFTRWWLQYNQKSYHPFFHFVSLYFSSFALICTALFVTQVLDLQLDHLGLFADPYRDSICTATLYAAAKAMVFALVLFYYPKQWGWYVVVVFYSLALHLVLIQANIVKIMIHPALFCLLIIACCTMMIFLLHFLNHCFLQMVSRDSQRV